MWVRTGQGPASSGMYVPSRHTYQTGLCTVRSPLLSKSMAPNTVSNWWSQGGDHRLKLERASFLGRLRPDLNGTISVQGVAGRLKT
jgi:hypothetical protein